MFKKIAQFIKYNTLVTIAITVAFVAVASAMANEDARDKIIGEEIIEKSGVDNTALLAADLDNFDMAMQITGAMEDPPEVEDPELSPTANFGASGNFYIDYQYKTLAIKDNVWQEVWYEKQMTVSKRSLDGRDLGLYVMEELGEIIDYQLAYLKEVQENEEDKGVTVVLETTEYTGLIGLVLDTKTKELPGYEPVVQPEVAEVVADSEPDSELSSGYPELSSDPPPPPLEISSDENEIPAEAAYWEQVENNCLNNGGFWYNETCNAEEEPPLVPPSEEGEETVAEELIPADEEEPVVEEPPVEEEPVSEEPTDETPAEEEAPTEEPVREDEPVDEDPMEEEPVDEPTEETEDSTSSE